MNKIKMFVGTSSFVVLLGQAALALAPELYLPFCGVV